MEQWSVSVTWAAADSQDAVSEPARVAKLHVGREQSTHDAVRKGSFPVDGERHVESFCINGYQIVAAYDAPHITKLHISVGLKTDTGTAHESPATRVEVTTLAAGETEDRHHGNSIGDTCVSSNASFVFQSDADVAAVLFRVQLRDGSWLARADSRPFCVGLRASGPLCIEAPLPWPINRPVLSSRVLALYRASIFWMQPQFAPEDLRFLLQDSAFVLVQTRDAVHDSHGDEFACLIASHRDLRDGARGGCGLRASFFGTGSFSALRVEALERTAQPRATEISGMAVCHLATANTPFTAVHRAVESYSRHCNTLCSRLEKVASNAWRQLHEESRVLNRLGYCTWDGHGHACSRKSVLSSMKWFEANDVPIGYVVIDDGWQDGGSQGPLLPGVDDNKNRGSGPKLASFAANEKFGWSLQSVAGETRSAVFAWLTILGYWGGVDGSRMDPSVPAYTRTVKLMLQASIGLREKHREEMNMWEREYEIVEPAMERVDDFFLSYFEALKAQGVRGVKVDAQSLLGSLRRPPDMDVDSDVDTVGMYRIALQRASRKVFPNEVVLNSMACSAQTILSSGMEGCGSNVVWRTSDDHAFPGVEETDEMCAWHILRNGATTMFLGAIVVAPDWDMFALGDCHGFTHAVARVISGGPVTISDGTPEVASEVRCSKQWLTQLAGRLTTHDGRVLRCTEAGRPTKDCIFTDPRECRAAYKLRNRTWTGAAMGLFNLCTGTSAPSLTASFSAADSEAFIPVERVNTCSPMTAAFVSIVQCATEHKAFVHVLADERHAVELDPLQSALVCISPVIRPCFSTAGGADNKAAGEDGGRPGVAVMGRLDVMLGTGAVHSVAWRRRLDCCGWVAEVWYADWGDVALWLDDLAVAWLRKVLVDGLEVAFEFRRVGDVRFLIVHVAPQTTAGTGCPFSCLLQLDFGS